jgi:hypothetical protein
MANTHSFAHSNHKWQQQPKHVSHKRQQLLKHVSRTVAATNINTTEFCAFCACKQHQWPNTRPFASPASKEQQWSNSASEDNTYTNKMNTTTALAFSVYQQKRRPKHGPKKDASNATNDTMTLFTLSFYSKQPQPDNASNGGICTENYYTCLDDNDTDDESDTYNNDTTNDEHNNGTIRHNGNFNNNTDNRTPSTPLSRNRFRTLTPFFPSSALPSSTMTPHKTNGNNDHQDSNNGTKNITNNCGNTGKHKNERNKNQSRPHHTPIACCCTNDTPAHSLQHILR